MRAALGRGESARPQAVVEVEDVQVERQLVANQRQNVQQRHLRRGAAAAAADGLYAPTSDVQPADSPDPPPVGAIACATRSCKPNNQC